MKKNTALRATALLLALLCCLAPVASGSGEPDDIALTAATTPDMTPDLTPEPTPTPDPTVPGAAPEPTGAPAVEITPEIPKPSPELTLSAEPTHTPEPTPDGISEPTEPPAPTESPEPTETVYPIPVPEPTPEPTILSPEPDLAPDPSMEPSLDPSPMPTTLELTLALEPTESPAPDGDDSEEDLTGEEDESGLELTRNKPRLDWRGVVPADDGGMPIPRLYQYDYRTVLCHYNGIPRSVCTSGCNVTCVAMVTAYLTGEEHSPEKLFSWALRNNLYHGNGLGHSQMSKVAAKYGVSGKWIGRDGDAVIEALKDGKPVIAHMGPGLFTTRGHYIVLRGVTEDGKILINDPNSARMSKLAFPMRTILRETRNSTPFMVCDAKEQGAQEANENT